MFPFEPRILRWYAYFPLNDRTHKSRIMDYDQGKIFLYCFPIEIHFCKFLVLCLVETFFESIFKNFRRPKAAFYPSSVKNLRWKLWQSALVRATDLTQRPGKQNRVCFLAIKSEENKLDLTIRFGLEHFYLLPHKIFSWPMIHRSCPE